MGSNDFLFTWKADNWPYENLKELVDKFEAGQVVTAPWRCAAHRMIREGDRAYLYKQGNSQGGIFAVAEVVGPAKERNDAGLGEGKYMVPLRFEVLLDPTKRLLVPLSDLLGRGAPDHRWNTQASGVQLKSEVARFIDAAVARERSIAGSALHAGGEEGSLSPTKSERLTEVYERDQTLVAELKALYKGFCQICDAAPFGGAFGDIVEGHHIEWLSRGGQLAR